MVMLGRGGSPSREEMRVTSVSVPDIGRSLRLARERAGLSHEEVAERTGLATTELEALESGTVGRMADRVETLRSMRTYALSLGLPGNEYVLATLELWPSVDDTSARGADSGQVPAVSVSSAPAGGHSQAETSGTVWIGDRTGVTDGVISGAASPRLPTPASDTGPVTIDDTGEIPVVRQAVPTALKVLVSLAGVLVLLGTFTLTEHSHFSTWSKNLRADSNHWIHNAKVAAGLTPKQSAASAAGATTHGPPVVQMVPSARADGITVNVHARSFSVKMVAFKHPSWMQITDADQAVPIYQQVMASGANDTFTVTRSLTVETGSSSARAYIYEGTVFIGYYFPSKAPYTMTFNALG